jgi:hypothetical protein
VKHIIERSAELRSRHGHSPELLINFYLKANEVIQPDRTMRLDLGDGTRLMIRVRHRPRPAMVYLAKYRGASLVTEMELPFHVFNRVEGIVNRAIDGRRPEKDAALMEGYGHPTRRSRFQSSQSRVPGDRDDGHTRALVAHPDLLHDPGRPRRTGEASISPGVKAEEKVETQCRPAWA